MRFPLSCMFIGCFYLSAPLVLANNNTLPKSCTTECATHFGKKLGTYKEVVGYSNCNPDCESDEWNIIKLKEQAVKTGMKWQCVEYARRWYVTRLGYTFASIDHAYQIWDLNTAIQLATQHETRWLKFYNGKTIEKPSANDLLIYNTKQGVHGHVSVITEVKQNQILIAEQNYANASWKHNNYARSISLIKNQKGQYKLNDLGLIGWMRLEKP